MKRRQAVGLLALALLAGCDLAVEPFAGTTDPELLTGEEWTLASFMEPGKPPERVFITLTATFRDSLFDGIDGPNRYGGRYEADHEGRIRIWDVIGTAIGGPDAVTAARYMRQLGGAVTFEVTETRLRIRSAEGTVLYLER